MLSLTGLQPGSNFPGALTFSWKKVCSQGSQSRDLLDKRGRFN